MFGDSSLKIYYIRHQVTVTDLQDTRLFSDTWYIDEKTTELVRSSVAVIFCKPGKMVEDVFAELSSQLAMRIIGFPK